MKIGFKKGHKWYSPIVRTLTTSQWSHAGVWIGERFYESTATKGTQYKSGVRDYPITPEIIAEYEWFDCPVKDEFALDRYYEVQSFGYDYVSLLAFLTVHIRDAKRLYCYELVLYMMTGEADYRVTPEVLMGMILRLQKLEKLYG